MPFLRHCSTNSKLRILVKTQPAPQAPDHCHQLGLAYGRENWVYPTNTYTLGHCGLSAASRHKLASTYRHYLLLTATDMTALYYILLLVFFFFFFFFLFEHNCSPSGKKTVTGVQVITASQVQSIGCRWQALLILPITALSRSTRGTHFQVMSKGTNFD